MRSRTLLAAGIGAALITLAGCGGTVPGTALSVDSGGGSPAGSSQKITTVADLGAIVQHNATGKNTTHLTMTMNIGSMGNLTATGDLKFAGAQTAEQMDMTLPGMGDMRMILIGTTIYMKLPSDLAGIAGGSSAKPWTKLDLSGDSALSQSLGSTAGLADQTDPTQLIKKITQAGTITSVTHDTVDGAPATHYAITVDVRKLLATAGATDSVQSKALSQLGLKSMPFDVWVNSDNLPVKITLDMATGSLGPAGSGAPTQVHMTVTYTNWGEQVNITPPPADQVGTMGGN